MTVNYNEVLRDEGAAAYVTAITAEGAQDVPPQQANLRNVGRGQRNYGA